MTRNSGLSIKPQLCFSNQLDTIEDDFSAFLSKNRVFLQQLGPSPVGQEETADGDLREEILTFNQQGEAVVLCKEHCLLLE